MGIINERRAIKTNVAINMTLPEVEDGCGQILLIYEASEELHKAHIKDEIVLFLNKNKAEKITAYANSSIYFQLKNVTSTVITDLNAAFEKHMDAFGKANNDGKIFWMFNELAIYKPVAGGTKRRAGMWGKGNRTIKDSFEAEVKLLTEKK